MKNIILVTCLLFSLPLGAVQFERGGRRYTAANTEFKYPVRCLKLTNTTLYQRSKREYKLFEKSYKKSTIKKYLKKVVFCKYLALDNVWSVRGTYNLNKKTLFIEVDYATNDTEYLLHHEFSSILLLSNHKLRDIRQKWITNNVVYYKPLYHMTSGKSGYKGNFPLLRMKGFLYPYSRTNFENDFNVMAAYYKADYLRRDLHKAAKNYSRINNKFLLIKNFYNKF